MVFVYGLSEEHPLILLTNRDIKSKEELVEVVRLYFSRWRVEEYFRAKKQSYGLENMRVRSLNSINNLNLMNTMVIGHVGQLSEEIEESLLSIKIKQRSNSIRNRVLFWYYQIAKGIREILAHAKTGISILHNIEVRPRTRQMRFNL